LKMAVAGIRPSLTQRLKLQVEILQSSAAS